MVRIDANLPTRVRSCAMPPPPPAHTRGESPEDRLRAIEERVGFAEHTTDQLSSQLVRAFADIQRLRDRLETLETRLERLAGGEGASGEPDAADPLERPPHSAGPMD
jgi:uncharacterized coiled-coil protein SlyX